MSISKSQRYLTKSRFKLGLECPKKLFYYGKENQFPSKKNHNEFLEILAEGGYQVGELAKHYYKFLHPDYQFVDITSLDYETSIEETKKALKHDKVVIAEPAICVEHFFIRVDILVKTGKSIQMIEVKSKSCSSDNPYDFLSMSKTPITIKSQWRPYLADVSFQTYVTTKALPDYHVTPYLLLVNKTKTSNMDGLNQLFKIVKAEGDSSGYLEVEVDNNGLEQSKELIKDTVLESINVQPVVDAILWEKQILGQPFFDQLNRPLRPFNPSNNATFIEAAHQLADWYHTDTPFDKTGMYIGAQCGGCEFKHSSPEFSGYVHCWTERFPNFDSENDHVFSVWNFPKNKINPLLEEGVYTIPQLVANQHLNPLNPSGLRYFRQQLQMEKSANQDTSEWVSDSLADEMSSWQYPLHFIDFETCTVALPFHKDEHPYAMIASQFSIHTLKEDGTIVHCEWLADKTGVDPTIQFVQELQSILSKDHGSIFMYANHENAVLKAAKQRMIPHQEQYQSELAFIDAITFTKGEHHPPRAMINLCKIVEQHYYHPLTKGSNSLKAVLPAIMQTSPLLKDLYSSPLLCGTNLKDYILYKEDNGSVSDPYDLLPKLTEIISTELNEALFQKDSLKDGSGAMKAFQVLQFSDIEDSEKKGLRQALLNYCELDTLAMVMLYQHLKYLSQNC